jgi:hypothetical protein
MNLQLKTKKQYFLTLLHSCSETIGYILIFLFPLMAVAQSPSTTIHLENDVAIYEIKHLDTAQVKIKNSHAETIYITKETLFYVDTSLVTSLEFIKRKENCLKSNGLKPIANRASKVVLAIIKKSKTIQVQFKHQKISLPYTSDRTFGSDCAIVICSSFTPTFLKYKNSVQTLITKNSTKPAFIRGNQKLNYIASNRRNASLLGGIVANKRPPPYYLV